MKEHGATSCTDVTGFGLLGHLLEMTRATKGIGATLDLEKIPLLPGALEVVSKVRPVQAPVSFTESTKDGRCGSTCSRSTEPPVSVL